MKLISCYIEKFGGLSQYSLDFSQGVTLIEEANGFGKTTLAEFLRAMFYGFPRKGKSLDKSKRQKYTPWSGGKFGGNLIFEVDGKQYRLERTFGATPRSDSFNLIDLSTNRKSDRFSEEIGLELFQLDADSFERSTYLPQMQENLALTTDRIQAKLTDLVEDTNDLGNFDKAINALKTSRSAFVPYRGSGGSVAEAANQITKAQTELDLAGMRKTQLESTEAEITALEEQIGQGRTQLEQVRLQWQQASEWAAVRGQYEDCRGRHDAARATIQMLENDYPKGVPGDGELADVRQTAEKLAVLADGGLTFRECQQYEKLCSARDAGLLEKSRLDALAEQNKELLRLRAALESMTVSEEDRQQMAYFNEKFSGGLPGREQLDHGYDLLSRCDTLREENLRLARVEKKPNLWILILGAVMLLAGLLLAPAGVLQYGLLGGGTVLLITGLIFLVQTNRRNRQCRTMAVENEDAIAGYEKIVSDFVRPLSSVTDLSGALEDIRHNIVAAAALQEKLRLRKEKQDAQAGAVRSLEEELCRQLGTEDFDKAISDLRLAKEQLNRWEDQECRRRESMGEYETQLNGFFARFGLARTTDLRQQLQRIYDDGRKLEQTRQLAEELSAQLRQFPEIPEDAADPEQLKLLLRELETEQERLTEKLAYQRQRCSELRRDADRLPEIQDNLEFWQEKRLADQRKAQILDDTMAFLQEARDNLTTSYLGPIRQHFARYLEKLTEVTGEKVFISPELKVQLERLGEARDLAYFSAGQSDTVMLCMRLALMDALFTEEKPFVILDDPFVNLDDERTAKALELLQELGRERQIIYLTCNSSRAPQ